jgi:hypothetical protein
MCQLLSTDYTEDVFNTTDQHMAGSLVLVFAQMARCRRLTNTWFNYTRYKHCSRMY